MEMKKEPMPKRPSNQSKMRVEQDFGTWFAIGGGICATGSTSNEAITKYNLVAEKGAMETK